jgi:hypothetical protein
VTRFVRQGDQGPMLCFLKIFSLKKLAKKLAFLAQSKAKLSKTWIITLDFEKSANFFSHKIGKNRINW